MKTNENHFFLQFIVNLFLGIFHSAIIPILIFTVSLFFGILDFGYALILAYMFFIGIVYLIVFPERKSKYFFVFFIFLELAILVFLLH